MAEGLLFAFVVVVAVVAVVVFLLEVDVEVDNVVAVDLLVDFATAPDEPVPPTTFAPS